MSKHSEIANDLFTEQYNCAQSVFVAFCDRTGLDRVTALKIASSFGKGIAREQETCGAICGMEMAFGAICGFTDPKDPETKHKHGELSKELYEEFRNEMGVVTCRELLNGQPSHSPICFRAVKCASEILDRKLAEDE